MHPLRCVGIYFIKSKSICADPQDSSPRNLTLCGRRRATGKGKGCVLSSAKIILLFRIAAFFCEKTFSFFDLAKGETKTRGLFSIRPLFLSSLPLFLRSPSCYGGKSVADFSLHSAFVPFPVPLVSAPSRMTLARVGTHPRLAHSASFHFFAFTPHAQPTELLPIRCEDLCISTICSGG